MFNDELSYNCLNHSYKFYFSDENNLDLNLLKKDEIEDLYDNAFKIVQYGWKKEAVPFIHEKKSLIARFFDLIFK